MKSPDESLTNMLQTMKNEKDQNVEMIENKKLERISTHDHPCIPKAPAPVVSFSLKPKKRVSNASEAEILKNDKTPKKTSAGTGKKSTSKNTPAVKGQNQST